MSPEFEQTGTTCTMFITTSPMPLKRKPDLGGFHRTSSAPLTAPDTHEHLASKPPERRSIFGNYWDCSHHSTNHHALLSTRFSSCSFSDKDALTAYPPPFERLLKRSGGGCFPLNEPKSILREHHDLPTLVPQGDSTDSSTDSSLHRSVHFDPRVTITELADTTPRKWYTEAELEKFKNDTIAISRGYLLRHPALIPEYSEPLYDPVTKTWRKKALFSLPILRTEISKPFELPSIPMPVSLASLAPTKSISRLSCIKRILVVMQNDKIRDLMKRSLAVMAKDACIDCAASGKEALLRIQEEVYDIVLSSQKIGGMDICEFFRSFDTSATLLIIITANPPAEEFQEVADLCWSIPPPRMDLSLLEHLHKRLVTKKQSGR